MRIHFVKCIRNLMKAYFIELYGFKLISNPCKSDRNAECFFKLIT